MVTRRRLISVFLIAHLTAITLAAVPSPERLDAVYETRHPTNDRLAAAVTPVLDRFTAALARVHRAVWTATHRVRWPADYYTAVVALGQNWAMFYHPPSYERYFRVSYYVEAHSGRRWVVDELVYPAYRQDRVRLLTAFRGSYQDKAFEIAYNDFIGRRDRGKPPHVDPAARPSQLPDELAPVARYFSKRFRDARLLPDDRLTRTEVWHGVAPIPPPGVDIDQQALKKRAAILERYYAGPIEQPLPKATSAHWPYHQQQLEGDIVWTLEYFEE